jgi:hypothetical protein
MPTHLVPVVGAGEVEAMSGGPNGTAQDHPPWSDMGCGDLHATKYQWPGLSSVAARAKTVVRIVVRPPAGYHHQGGSK